jgi:hypothetical protein
MLFYFYRFFTGPKSYVGVSKNIIERIKSHLRGFLPYNDNVRASEIIQYAEQHGTDICLQIICVVDLATRYEAEILEQFIINNIDCVNYVKNRVNPPNTNHHYLKTKVKCSCCCMISKRHLSRHQRTMKHLNSC